MLAPFNLQGWIEENRHLLKPPVGNKMLWNDGFLVMVVGGPNQRADYHVNPGEEFFYQVEGDIVLKVIENDIKRDIPIKQGEMFLLPANVPHSPRRPADTVGLVIERERPPEADDHLRWFCPKCDHLLHDARFHLVDLGVQLKPILESFKASKEMRTCLKCGHVLEM